MSRTRSAWSSWRAVREVEPGGVHARVHERAHPLERVVAGPIVATIFVRRWRSRARLTLPCQAATRSQRSRRTRPSPGRRPRRRAPPRCAAAGCTWPRGRCATGAPVLIWPALVATARSAMVVSSVSPERCEMTTAVAGSRGRARSRRASRVSVPIWLTLTRIALRDALLDAAAQALDVGHEEVVADELHPVAEPLRERAPGVPVVLGERILDRDEREALGQVARTRPSSSSRRVQHRRPRAGSRRPSTSSVAATSSASATRSRWPGPLGRLEHRLERLGGRRRGRARSRPRRRPPWPARARAARRAARGRPRRRCAAPPRTSPRRPGTTMNSCTSSAFCACAPPLTTFSIGTGRTCAVGAADPAVQRHAGVGGAAFAAASEQPRMAFAPSRLLFGVPSSSTSAASSARWSRGVEALERRRDLAVDVARPPARRPCRPTRRRRRAARRPRARPVEAPDGTAARPEGARLEHDLDLDGRVPPRVEDLPARHPGDHARHPRPPLLGPVVVALLLVERQLGPRLAGRRREALRLLHTRAGTFARSPRSASSGSTFCCRATFTTVKSTSPTSSTTRASGSDSGAGAPARAISAASSSSSSRTFAERRLRRPASRSRADDRAPLHLAREEQRRQRLGHVVEDPARGPRRSRLIASQRSRTRPAVRASASPKTCG